MCAYTYFLKERRSPERDDLSFDSPVGEDASINGKMPRKGRCCLQSALPIAFSVLTVSITDWHSVLLALSRHYRKGIILGSSVQ